MTHPVARLQPVVVRLALPQPYDADSLLDFLSRRTVPGVEELRDRSYSRTLRLTGGPALVRLELGSRSVRGRLWLSDVADRGAAVRRCRWLLDLDTDLVAVESHLMDDPRLAASVQAHPGLRVPGHVDGFEVAVRAVVGQQISVAGARTILSRLVSAYGDEVALGESLPPGPLNRLFPGPEAIAAVDPEALPMPRARGRALVGVAAAVATGRVALDRSMPLDEVRAGLLALPGIGPWTADYIALRALGDKDVFMSSDLGVRNGLVRMGLGDLTPERRQGWSPWRSYALMHVWKSLDEEAA